MTAALLGAAALVLLLAAPALLRLVRASTTADRLAAVQLFATAGIAALVLVEAAGTAPGAVDLALALAILAPCVALGFGADRGAGEAFRARTGGREEPR